jgi:hypothetical protein
MKYRSYIPFLNTILTYRNLIFHAQNIGISYRNGMLKRYLRIVCKIGISYCFRYEILIQFHLGSFSEMTRNITLFNVI